MDENINNSFVTIYKEDIALNSVEDLNVKPFRKKITIFHEDVIISRDIIDEIIIGEGSITIKC